MSIRLPRRFTCRTALPSLMLSLLIATVTTSGAERGLPQITVYPAEVHKAGPQSFDIAQDTRGILYFGNLQGLVTYDGAWWRKAATPASPPK